MNLEVEKYEGELRELRQKVLLLGKENKEVSSEQFVKLATKVLDIAFEISQLPLGNQRRMLEILFEKGLHYVLGKTRTIEQEDHVFNFVWGKGKQRGSVTAKHPSEAWSKMSPVGYPPEDAEIVEDL